MVEDHSITYIILSVALLITVVGIAYLNHIHDSRQYKEAEDDVEALDAPVERMLRLAREEALNESIERARQAQVAYSVRYTEYIASVAAARRADELSMQWHSQILNTEGMGRTSYYRGMRVTTESLPKTVRSVI